MESNIPQQHIEFCKAVAKLATEFKLNSVGLTFQPGYQDQWHDQIQMSWTQGRHGAERNNLTVTSTVQVRAAIDA